MKSMGEVIRFVGKSKNSELDPVGNREPVQRAEYRGNVSPPVGPNECKMS